MIMKRFSYSFLCKGVTEGGAVSDLTFLKNKVTGLERFFQEVIISSSSMKKRGKDKEE